MSTMTKVGLLVLLAVTAAACTVKDTEAPPLAGPSELGLRLDLSLTPDAIFQDGFSQTVLTVEATNADGRPARGVAMRVDISEGGLVYDLGTLSSKNLVTGDDGRARATYTAPPREMEGEGRVITFLVTPIGDDYRGAVYRQVDLRLIQPGVILPPNGAPVPAFAFAPSAPAIMDTVTFDASETTDEGSACGMNCTYSWDFGDRTTSSGIFTTHEFRDVGNYQVRLTVTDRRGVSSMVARTVQVVAGTRPTAAFTFSPATPLPGQMIFFNASASAAAPGRYIYSYEWDFGSGRTASGVSVSKGYNTNGTYRVTLVVTDDAGQTGTVTQEVKVGVSASASGDGPRPATVPIGGGSQ